MSTTEKTISGLIESQLPDFINEKYQENAPSFRRFIELYYTWLEDSTKGNTVYHIMSSEKYRDIDETEEGFFTYFKNELLPYFPERTELELVKILKGAKEFYSKKGTENSIKWLFRVLFNKEANIYYPRENILKASDGKWQLPVSIKVSGTPLVIQTASSSQNYFASNPHPIPVTYHSSNVFSTVVEFDNDIRRRSTVIAFASYKIWIDSAYDPTSIKNYISGYMATTSNFSSLSEVGNNIKFERIVEPLISDNLDGYGALCYQVVESFYSNNVVLHDGNKTLEYKSSLTPFSIASITNLGYNTANTVKIQFDGIEAFELGGIGELVTSNSSYKYSTTDASVTVPVTLGNTPCFIFSFAKEEVGETIIGDTSNNYTITDSLYGDDRYLLQYSKEYQVSNVVTKFTSANSANIAVISFGFKEKAAVPVSNFQKRYIVGDVSKARAVIERAYNRIDFYTKTPYTEIFLSNIEGEFINNELVYIDDGEEILFEDRILGFVNGITIDPNNRGLKYKIGDPAVIYGGFISDDGKTTTAGFKYATAEVSDITDGIIKSLTLVKGGYGYRNHPNTIVTVVNDPSDTTGNGATVQVSGVDTTANITLFLATDTILPYANTTLNSNPFSPAFPNNALSNINSTLISCFSFTGIDFYPITSLTLTSEGIGYSAPPTLSFNTVFQVDGTTNVAIDSLGFLAAVEIITPGTGYSNGDILLFNGVNGPAEAYINVSPSGAVASVNITSRGYGYTTMPTVTANSVGGIGATFKAYGFNDGAEATLTVDAVGAITGLSMTNPGFGYVSKPNVSLKVMDVYVSNLSTTFSPDSTLTVYQGTDPANATFTGSIDIGYASENNQDGSSNAIIRIYDYNGTISTNSASYIVVNETGQHLKTNLGSLIYGNGFAKANIVFIDGTVTYPGYFLNTDGFLSADKRLQDKNKYHNFSYIIDSDKQLKTYKETMFNVLHPSGSELIAHYRIQDTYEYKPAISHKIVKTNQSYEVASMHFKTFPNEGFTYVVYPPPAFPPSPAYMYNFSDNYTFTSNASLIDMNFPSINAYVDGSQINYPYLINIVQLQYGDELGRPAGLWSNNSAVGIGAKHTATIKTDGTLWSWGNNTSGQLGTGDTTPRSSPVTTAGGGTTWSKIAVGQNFTAGIKTDGRLWTWGINSSGQLGTGTTTSRSSPGTTAGGGTTWSKVACGAAHIAAIKTDGRLWTWGDNANGQLGNNNTAARSSPGTTIGGGTTWTQVSCGTAITAAIKTDGTLWTWGSNFQGQLGDGSTTDRSSPGTLSGGGTTWKQVSCGYQHTAAVKTDGTLWNWGAWNNLGDGGVNYPLGVSSPIQVIPGDVTWNSVACGNYHTAAIKTDGSLWVWGEDFVGELGTGTLTPVYSPVETATGGTTWDTVSCGYKITSAVKTDGTLWVWGLNDSGQLGVGSTINKEYPGQTEPPIGIPSTLGSPVLNGDTITINYDTPNRKIIRTVNTTSTINGYDIIYTTQPVFIFGYGTLTGNGTQYLVATENVAGKIITNDGLRITNSSGYVFLANVANNPINNVIEVDSAIYGNVMSYIIDPYIAAANIKFTREV